MSYLYAFDLSMKCSGLVIFDLETKKPIVVTSFPTKIKWSHGKRLNQFYEGVKEYVKQYPITEVAIERGFSRFNNETQAIFRVHGLLNWMMHKYEQFYYPPTSVKAAILTGNSSKEAIANKINLHFPEVEFENNDQSDAFAVGLCHMIMKRGMAWEKSSRGLKKASPKPKAPKPKAVKPKIAKLKAPTKPRGKRGVKNG